MRVWITRSRPGAERLAAALEAAGFEPMVGPVTGIEATGTAPPDGGFDRVFFLSEHAVRFCADLGCCADASVYAVGPATAAALGRRGISAILPVLPGSDGLLERAELEDVSGERLLIVAGEDGRKDLLAGLEARGGTVRELLCYRRVSLEVAPARLIGIDVILVGSQDGFRAVARLWFDAGGRSGVPVLTPSARVSALGASLGFTRVVTCEGPSSEAFISGLRALETDAGTSDEKPTR